MNKENTLQLSQEDFISKPKAQSFFSKYKITLFLMTLPALIYIVIFHYVPIGGLVIAFKDYDSFSGIWGSPWTSMGGFQHFVDFVNLPNFGVILKNTLTLSVLSIVFNSLLPIVFALFLNEIRAHRYKRFIQTIMYAPYFISTVVLVGMLFAFFNGDNGIFTRLLRTFGYDGGSVMENPDYFAAIYVISGVWQGLGWWSIVYMGTLANVDPNLHDAAIIDGAGRLRRIFYVNFPAIVPLAVTMFIMSIGNVLNVGFEKVWLMQLQTNLSSSEIISTYVYRVSFPDFGLPQFSYATAIGLFNSAINIVILIIANKISKKVSETSLW
ncbi:MAG: sugar ABC transporter permease [Ruminococcaceae bacterium]|nr:sugar ABC transporter permease [Oscillospiraceae bacterium]